MIFRSMTYLGVALCTFTGASAILPALFFFAGVPVAPFQLVLAGLTSIAVCSIGLWHEPNVRFLPTLGGLSLTLLFTIFLAVLLAGAFFDVSWDGPAYHQDAVISLANGWNPLSKEDASLWVNHYAKAPWHSGALLYQATGRIQTAKAHQLLLIFAAFLLAASALRRAGVSPAWSLTWGGLAALNPVAICQSLSFYVDGMLASCLTLFLALLCLIYFEPRRWMLVPMALLVCFTINLKFTALVYIVMFSTASLGFFHWNKSSQLRSVAASLALAIVVGVLAVGYNPYVKNFVDKGHPFYPLMGPSKVDIMTTNSPPDFSHRNRIQKLFFSLFSASSNSLSEFPVPKIPFSILSTEHYPFTTTDTRIGGFGPWFGGALLLSLLLIRRSALLLFVAGCLLVSVFANPEAWWARYAPQLWLLPIFLGAAGAQKKRAALLAAALSVNVVFITNEYLRHNIGATTHVLEQLDSLAGSEILVQFNGFEADAIRLKEHRVSFREVKELFCAIPTPLVGSSGTKFCP